MKLNNRGRLEIKIGSIYLQEDNSIIQCISVDDNICTGCIYDKDCKCNNILACSNFTRDDGNNVIFTKLNKVD